MRVWYVVYTKPAYQLIVGRDRQWVRFMAKFAKMDIGRIRPEYLISGVVAQRRTK